MRSDLDRIALGKSPRRDYLELANELGAAVVDAGSAQSGWIWRLIGRLVGRDIPVVMAAQRRLGGADVVFTDNERLGSLLALSLRLPRRARPRHVMLGHHLSPRKKQPFLRLARSAIDLLIVHSMAQKQVAVERLGIDADAVVVLPYQVDTEFWRPREHGVEDLISSAGLEFRDYETLLAAADGLGVEVAVGAASNWSQKRNSLSRRPLPSWFTVGTYDYEALRDLYVRSRFVVAPLLETDFQAGITLILEAMACGSAVLVSHTSGQRETVLGPLWSAGDVNWPIGGLSVVESTGIYVPPGDVGALRAAMKFMLTNPDVCAALGANGRRLVEAEFTVELFAKRFAAAIAQAGAEYAL